ncbi:hypothetical protein O4215_10945 [Rhodococcus maanshanensis]|nr:hypothetical protein [Rhodococcus maanshanensis]MCZ4556093.1 hypothetical protein [Rhodococcus maanshanensis]
MEFAELAVVGVPYAIVRRRLRNDAGLPERAEEMAAEAARALLDRVSP